MPKYRFTMTVVLTDPDGENEYENFTLSAIGTDRDQVINRVSQIVGEDFAVSYVEFIEIEEIE